MENQYIIKGGTPLNGEVTIGGAKNAALGILAAAIMADETVVIDNLPNVRDINVLLTAIESIGATVKRIGPHVVSINGSTINDMTIVMTPSQDSCILLSAWRTAWQIQEGTGCFAGWL